MYMTSNRVKAPVIRDARETGLMDISKNMWVFCQTKGCPNHKKGWVVEWIKDRPGFYDEEQARCGMCHQIAEPE